MQIFDTLKEGDRVAHQVKGTGTVSRNPDADGLVVPAKEESKSGPDMVYVVWDDDRFPVGKVPAPELELLPAGAAAISPGY